MKNSQMDLGDMAEKKVKKKRVPLYTRRLRKP